MADEAGEVFPEVTGGGKSVPNACGVSGCVGGLALEMLAEDGEDVEKVEVAVCLGEESIVERRERIRCQGRTGGDRGEVESDEGDGGGWD